MPRSAEAQPWFRRSVLLHNPRVRRARLRTPPPPPGWRGGRARRARRVRAPPPRAGRRAPNALSSPPFPPPPSPAAHALARVRARGCLVAQANKCVLLSTPHRPNPSTPPLSQPPNLVRVSFAPTASPHTPAPAHPTLARCPSRPRRLLPRPTCLYSLRTASAHPPPTHVHHRSPAPQLPSSLALRPRHLLMQEVSPPPPPNRAAGSTPAARTPSTHCTGCLASPPSARVCPFLHAAPPQTLDLH